MSLKSLFVTLAGGAALWKLFTLQQQRVRNVRAVKPAAPAAETLWENEGGALRDTGAQLGPSPALP